MWALWCAPRREHLAERVGSSAAEVIGLRAGNVGSRAGDCRCLGTVG